MIAFPLVVLSSFSVPSFLIHLNSLDSRKPRFLQIVANNGMKISIEADRNKVTALFR